MRRAQTLGQIVNHRQRDAGASGTDNQRRNRDLQPVQQARFQEGGYGQTAAFDKNSEQSAILQLPQHFGQQQALTIAGNADDLRLTRPRFIRYFLSAH